MQKNKEVYLTQSPFLSVGIWAFFKPLRWLVGVSYSRLSICLLFGMLVYFGVLVSSALRTHRHFTGCSVRYLFLVIGLLVTNPALWIALPYFNVDISYYLPTLFFAIIPFYSRSRARLLRCFIVLSLLSPLYSPLLAILGLGLKLKSKIKLHIWYLLGIILAGILAGLYPRILLFLVSDFKPFGSGYLFRSGLDGDARAFDTVFTAITSPFQQSTNRPWHLFYELAVLTAVLFLLYLQGSVRLIRSAGRAILIAGIPYIYFVVFFPQHVAMHPYVHDLNLFIISASGFFRLIIPIGDSRIARSIIFGPLLFFLICSVIMMHLIDIARFASLIR